jgi:hypothetical protein
MNPLRPGLAPLIALLALWPATHCIGRTRAVLDAGLDETVTQFKLLDPTGMAESYECPPMRKPVPVTKINKIDK